MNFHDMFPPDPNKETVTEDMHPEKAWFAEAGKMTEEELPNFFERIIHGYNHDYGTACHAVAACGDDGIGLSGFQAGFVMWDFIKNWTKTGNKCGLKLVDYDNMLYPQYEEKMDKTIRKSNWDYIQSEAKKNLENTPYAHPNVIKHWQSIVDGIVPFGYRVIDD